MKDYSTYFNKQMPDSNFGVDIFIRTDLKREKELRLHWHEHMQLYCFISGSALQECGKEQFEVHSKDIVVINSNELHYTESLSDDLKFYVIRIDLPFLFSSQTDLCQTKYLIPLSQNHIIFDNLIQRDEQIRGCVTRIINEYYAKRVGYELAIKSYVYQLIVLLLRGHVHKILTDNEFFSKINGLKRIDSTLHYIAEHYTEKISVNDLASRANITTFYFCRLFKQITGSTLTDYVNEIRLEKSLEYLRNSNLNITEIALCCGFDSINYYSRLFKTHYHTPPTAYRKSNSGIADMSKSSPTGETS